MSAYPATCRNASHFYHYPAWRLTVQEGMVSPSYWLPNYLALPREVRQVAMKTLEEFEELLTLNPPVPTIIDTIRSKQGYEGSLIIRLSIADIADKMMRDEHLQEKDALMEKVGHVLTRFNNCRFRNLDELLKREDAHFDVPDLRQEQARIHPSLKEEAPVL